MAVVTESAPAFDDDIESAAIEVRVRPLEGEETPQSAPVEQRVQYKVHATVKRSDGRPDGVRVTDWIDVDDGVVSTFVAGDAAAFRSRILKLYNHGLTTIGL